MDLNCVIGRPCGIQLSRVSDIGLSLTLQWLDREDHGFALPSDTWIGIRPPGSVKFSICRLFEHLLPAPVAATGLKLTSMKVRRNDAGPYAFGRSAATIIDVRRFVLRGRH